MRGPPNRLDEKTSSVKKFRMRILACWGVTPRTHASLRLAI